MSHCFKEVVMKNGLINKKNNEYIVLKKELYKRYGLSKGLILQVLTDNGGTFIGSIGQLTDIIGVITSESVKVRMNELVNDGVVQKQRVNGLSNKYTLTMEPEEMLNKRKIPESVKKIVQRLEEIKKEK